MITCKENKYRAVGSLTRRAPTMHGEWCDYAKRWGLDWRAHMYYNASQNPCLVGSRTNCQVFEVVTVSGKIKSPLQDGCTVRRDCDWSMLTFNELVQQRRLLDAFLYGAERYMK